MNIAARLKETLSTLPDGVRLVAVSKYHSEEKLKEVYELGQRVFGESHVQELMAKREQLPTDIEWHFIGHLQTNKVKYIAPYISMIDAVDSFKLLKEINKQAEKHNRVIKVLLELHIAEEETKFGLSIPECRDMLEKGEWRELKNIQICGLMTMASNTDDEVRIEQEFTLAADFFKEVKERYFSDSPSFCERSWGMSDDYHIAVRCQSTMVRVGTYIFGNREY